jgi:copper chaperone NosL
MFLIACQPAVDLSKPPEIRYGEDICTECNMIISEPRYAAAFYTSDGEAKIFDDIGGMAIYINEHQEEVDQYWVHDYDTEEWIAAEAAFFVVGEGLHTPMDHGVVSFSEESRAADLAAEVGGMVMTFTKVISLFAEGGSNHSHSEP